MQNLPSRLYDTDLLTLAQYNAQKLSEPVTVTVAKIVAELEVLRSANPPAPYADLLDQLIADQKSKKQDATYTLTTEACRIAEHIGWFWHNRVIKK